MFCLDLYGDIKNKEGLLLGQGVSPPCVFTQDWFPQLCVLAQKTASKTIKVWTSPKQQVHKVQRSNTRFSRWDLQCKAECCLGTVRYMQYLMPPHFTAVKSKLVSYTAAKHIVCLVKKNKGVKTVSRLNCWKWRLKWHLPLLHPDVDLPCRRLRSNIQYIVSLCSSWIIFSSTNAQARPCGSGATCYQVLLYMQKKSPAPFFMVY